MTVITPVTEITVLNFLAVFGQSSSCNNTYFDHYNHDSSKRIIGLQFPDKDTKLKTGHQKGKSLPMPQIMQIISVKKKVPG